MINQETRKAGRKLSLTVEARVPRAIRRFVTRSSLVTRLPSRSLAKAGHWSLFVVALLLLASASVANAGGGTPKPKPTPTPAPLVDGETDWKNTSTDWNTGGNWTAVTGTAPPAAGDVAWFKVVKSTNPNLSASASVAGLYFSSTASSNYTITATSPFTLTLTGTAADTSGTEDSNSSAAAIGANNTSGTNTISAPIILAPATGTNSTFYQAAGGTLTITGVISGSAISLTKTGTGTLTLNNVANTFSGGFLINSGTVTFNNKDSLGSGTVTLGTSGGGDATLTTSAGVTLIPNNIIVTSGSSGTLTLGSTSVSAGSYGVSAGTTTLTLNGNLSLTAAGTVNALTMNSLISGAGVLTKVGVGIVTMNNANTYSGGTILSAGTLQLATNGVVSAGGTRTSGPLGTGLLTLGDGVTLRSSGTTARTIQNDLSLSGNITLGDTTNTGALTFNSTAGANTLTTAATTTLTGNTTLTTLSAVTITDVISGGFSLTKAGASTLTLGGANLFTGGVTINAGTLIAGSTTALGPAANATLTFGSGSTGKFQLNGNNTTVIDLNTNATVGTPIIESGSGTAGTDILTVNTANTDNYAGVLQNGSTRLLGLTKSGAGTLTLSGTNTYTGATTVSGGTLFINGDNSAATGAFAVNGAGTVLGGIGTIGGKVTVAGGATPGSGAVLLGGSGVNDANKFGTLTVSNTSTGAITLNSGSVIELALGGTSTTHSTIAHTGTGTISFASNQVFTFLDFGATTITYDNIITGTGLSTLDTSGWSISNTAWVGTFALDASGNIDLNLTAVPEPSTWVAAALAFAVVCYSQRRRFKRLLART